MYLTRRMAETKRLSWYNRHIVLFIIYVCHIKIRVHEIRNFLISNLFWLQNSVESFLLDKYLREEAQKQRFQFLFMGH